jgi:hypothetical protein
LVKEIDSIIEVEVDGMVDLVSVREMDVVGESEEVGEIDPVLEVD